MELPILVIGLGIVFFVVGIVFYFVITLYRRVPPNKALIITGWGGKKVVVGGGTVVIPLLQTAQELSLEARIIDIRSPQILTLDKVPLSVEAVATVKIDSSNNANILSAAERFLGKSDQEIDKNIKEILEGHTREVIARTRLQQLLHDRDTFIQEVNKSAAKDLGTLGLKIDTITIKDIFDVKGSISLALSSSIVEINNLKVITQNQDKFQIRAACTIKFNLQELEKAGENFLNLTKEEALQVIKELLENKIRKYISTIKSEELSNEELLSQRMKECLKNDVKEYSLIIDSFNIKEIQKI